MEGTLLPNFGSRSLGPQLQDDVIILLALFTSCSLCLHVFSGEVKSCNSAILSKKKVFFLNVHFYFVKFLRTGKFKMKVSFYHLNIFSQ